MSSNDESTESNYLIRGHNRINKLTGKISPYEILPLGKDYKIIGKSLLKDISIRKKFRDYLKYYYGWHGMYIWGRNLTNVETKSDQGTCGRHMVCLNEDTMFFHTHPTPCYQYYKYLPPNGVDIMLTFKESFQKKKPTYSFLVDESGFYFYRPGDDLFKHVMETIAKKKSGWEFDIWKSWMEHTEHTELINDQMDEWSSYIFDIDIEDQLKKKNFKTANECLQHYYGKIGFDIYFIANDDKKCFNIFEEKIVNLVD